MAEEIVESPTLDQPKETPKVESPEGEEIDIDAFTQTLKEFNVTNNDELAGKLNASQQAGQTANLLGEERRRNEALQEELAALRAKSNQELDLDNYGEGQTVNLEDVITKVYRKEKQRDMALAQRQQQQQIAQYGKIVNNKNYKGDIKKLWDAKQADPTFLIQVQSGQIDPVEAFHEVVDEYKTNLIVTAGKTIDTLRTGKLPEVPHVETGERAPQNLVSETPSKEGSREQLLKELQDKTDKGGRLEEHEQNALLDSIFRESAK
ncbi:MAG: hypothetical protein ACXABF_15660 [Candidatus Thorarchaeota archaeon]|jgi:hypothetical protein